MTETDRIDYTHEVPPKVEMFSDHLEITSFGRLPEGLTKDDFFAGVSIPRNKELMRIFRDLELVESLGSGMGYIMQKYGRENFVFLDNFIRMTIPYITKDREGQPVTTVQVKVGAGVKPTSSLQVTPSEAQVTSLEAQVKAQVARHILVLLVHEPLGSSEIGTQIAFWCCESTP